MNNQINLLHSGDFEVLPEMDVCVICNTITNEPKNKHVDYRLNYIDGVGQLCKKCAVEKDL